jgi:hypothetical protein
MEFQAFDKIPRLRRGCVITEKIDGTNAQVCFADDGQMLVGSRNRWITPDNDNYGFARWCVENETELRKLGPGRHFGEWWGAGIQRRYNVPEHLLRPTRHVYERSRDVKDCSGNVIAREHLFKCVKTGAIRRWGLEVVE